MPSFDPIAAMAHERHEFGEHGGVNLSIEASTTFTVMQARTMPAIFQGRMGPEGGCYLYGRHFNPTVHALGRQLAAMENREAAYCTASGMAAIAATLLQCCETGDHIVASHTLYGGTYALLNEFLKIRAGITTTFVDITDHATVAAAITPQTKLIYTETLANPTLVVADLPALAAIAHNAGARLVVDNTFTPLLLSPAQWGADIVVHSLTKFIGGASDTIAGAICGDTAFIQQLMDLHQGALMLLGPTMDPEVAFRLTMRLPHLGLRMVAHSERTLALATRLADLGFDVSYPGLTTHPQHDLFTRLMNPEYGYGGLMTLDLGDEATANRFMELLQNRERFGYMAVSLGYFDTLMSCSGASTSSEMTKEEQAAAGIKPGLIRMSVGYSGTLEQRWSQLREALGEMGLAQNP